MNDHWTVPWYEEMRTKLDGALQRFNEEVTGILGPEFRSSAFGVTVEVGDEKVDVWFSFRTRKLPLPVVVEGNE